jgi:hypothetical protein
MAELDCKCFALIVLGIIDFWIYRRSFVDLAIARNMSSLLPHFSAHALSRLTIDAYLLDVVQDESSFVATSVPRICASIKLELDPNNLFNQSSPSSSA